MLLHVVAMWVTRMYVFVGWGLRAVGLGLFGGVFWLYVSIGFELIHCRSIIPGAGTLGLLRSDVCAFGLISNIVKESL